MDKFHRVVLNLFSWNSLVVLPPNFMEMPPSSLQAGVLSKYSFSIVYTKRDFRSRLVDWSKRSLYLSYFCFYVYVLNVLY